MELWKPWSLARDRIAELMITDEPSDRGVVVRVIPGVVHVNLILEEGGTAPPWQYRLNLALPNVDARMPHTKSDEAVVKTLVELDEWVRKCSTSTRRALFRPPKTIWIYQGLLLESSQITSVDDDCFYTSTGHSFSMDDVNVDFFFIPPRIVDANVPTEVSADDLKRTNDELLSREDRSHIIDRLSGDADHQAWFEVEMAKHPSPFEAFRLMKDQYLKRKRESDARAQITRQQLFAAMSALRTLDRVLYEASRTDA